MRSLLLMITLIIVQAQASWAQQPPAPDNINRDQPPTKTEAGICAVCEAEKAKHSNVGDLASVATKAGAQKPAPESEEMKQHLERVKERLIKKISNADCAQPGDDEDSGSPAMLSEIPEDDGPPDHTRGAGGADVSQMFAGHLDMMDDIQDAMDAKAEKCQKQAKKRMSSASRSNPGGGGGSANMQQNNNMNSMLLAATMGGMMGMGGYGSMSGYGMGMGGYGGMSGYGMSMMSPYGGMTYGGTSLMSPYGGMLGYGSYGSYGSYGTNSYMPYRYQYPSYSNYATGYNSINQLRSTR